MTTAIVGGGIMGVTLGYCLTQAGVPVTIYEGSPTLGGLAGPITLPDGVEVDRFYHAILSTDEHLNGLCRDLGLLDRMRFKPTGTLVYSGGKLESMNGLVDFLRFPPLRFIDRIRLGLTVLAANRVRDWHQIDGIPMRDWLVKVGGEEVYRRFWGPMLHVKFDGAVGDTPATWMWARLVRTRSTRRGVSQREECGHLIGGYRTLLDAMAERIRAGGGAIRLSTKVDRVAIEGGRVTGVVVGGQLERHDDAVVTMQAPVAARLVPEAPAEYRQQLQAQRYLGIVCPLFVLDRPLTNVWTLNIADAEALVTGVIETTSYIDPSFVGGHHLVYVPKYVTADSPWLTASDDEIRTAWSAALTRIVPGFADATVRHCLVHRERFVEPLHSPGAGSRTLPFDSPVTGLHLATTSQIYPALTNGESVTRHARDAADRLIARGGPMTRRRLRQATLAGLVAVVALATVNLTRWPAPWFDEGIHLHVPKALVRFGAYADYSSEGLRHFGPTQAVGPTVMLPIAAVFQLFGVGLLQARLVMAAYLVAFMAAFYLLGKRLGGRVAGLVGAVLLVSATGPSVVEYGRQALGEVPGGFLLAAGLLIWFRAWPNPSLARLVLAGVVLGLATATKHVYLLALGPALLAAWILNLVYYRSVSQRVFLVTGSICAAIFATWQVMVLGWLSPGGLAENWTLLRRTSEGAAFVFNTETSRKSLLDLLGAQGYFGLLLPALLYTGWRARAKTLPEQQWGVVWLIAVANLGWFVLASNGWTRYAFVGLTLSSLLVARLLRDIARAIAAGRRRGWVPATSLAVVLPLWLAAIIALPMASTAARLIKVPPADAVATAEWLTAHVPVEEVVETWEPELGVFTDHRFHYPPSSLLIRAVAHISHGGAAPATFYAFRDGGTPEYVVVGAFARWVGMYADGDLEADYAVAYRQGAYVVWKRLGRADNSQ